MTDATRGYPDLHAHLDALKAQGLLLTIDEPIDKDSELHALVRWQFVGGIEEAERKAFLFTNIVNAHGRRYAMPVVVGATSAAVAGRQLTVVCTVTNRGTGPVSGTWADGIYVSTNTVWDSTATVLGWNVNDSLTVAAGSRYTWTNTVSLPATPDGTYSNALSS